MIRDFRTACRAEVARCNRRRAVFTDRRCCRVKIRYRRRPVWDRGECPKEHACYMASGVTISNTCRDRGQRSARVVQSEYVFTVVTGSLDFYSSIFGNALSESGGKRPIEGSSIYKESSYFPLSAIERQSSSEI